jgi:hypothetical protein
VTDLLGRELTAHEAELAELYERLKTLLGEDLPPCAQAGVRAALVALWNVVNDLALDHEHLSDLGA